MINRLRLSTVMLSAVVGAAGVVAVTGSACRGGPTHGRPYYLVHLQSR